MTTTDLEHTLLLMERRAYRLRRFLELHAPDYLLVREVRLLHRSMDAVKAAEREAALMLFAEENET